MVYLMGRACGADGNSQLDDDACEFSKGSGEGGGGLCLCDGMPSVGQV